MFSVKMTRFSSCFSAYQKCYKPDEGGGIHPLSPSLTTPLVPISFCTEHLAGIGGDRRIHKIGC